MKGREQAQCCWCLAMIKALHRQGAALPCGPSKFTITGHAYTINPSLSQLEPFISIHGTNVCAPRLRLSLMNVLYIIRKHSHDKAIRAVAPHL